MPAHGHEPSGGAILLSPPDAHLGEPEGAAVPKDAARHEEPVALRGGGAEGLVPASEREAVARHSSAVEA